MQPELRAESAEVSDHVVKVFRVEMLGPSRQCPAQSPRDVRFVVNASLGRARDQLIEIGQVSERLGKLTELSRCPFADAARNNAVYEVVADMVNDL